MCVPIDPGHLRAVVDQVAEASRIPAHLRCRASRVVSAVGPIAFAQQTQPTNPCAVGLRCLWRGSETCQVANKKPHL